MTTYVRTSRRKTCGIVALSMLAALAVAAPRGARADGDGGPEASRMLLPRPVETSLASIIAQARTPIARPLQKLQPALDALKVGDVASALTGEDSVNFAKLGGTKAPAARVVVHGGSARGFEGIDLVTQANASGSLLEPPDQALCVGNGFVMEGVNLAFRIYSRAGRALTPAISMTKFFNQKPANTLGLVG
ncbi:MAG TPA: hypothetical protein VJ818_01385, partial [Actinomycetota bacterium]|nr:hypothetical protein [Actinomycetota bacterium]